MPEAPPRLQLPPRPADQAGCRVAAWREEVEMGTYPPDPPSRYPAFLDRRVYQGSSGRVYPLPFHDRISRERRPVRWDAVHLENDWIRLMVLPQLGGRIHVGLDRTNGYDFFYRNPVIKPALVGLAGPWIAGGVEFNWPQHHRPATFLPTDSAIEVEPDGAVTVWCSDHDPFTRMKGMHGVRLRPDRAVVEVRVRLYNRCETTQTFLWWANVAARVNPDYQSFFPRDVRVVADHAKRAVSAFPAADREYYGIDYPARRDRVATATDGTPVTGDRLDWYRNIPVPTSYMCLGSREGFFGGYDHAARAGFVHVADPHTAVGKKQWTWGNSGFGHAWDRNLADDGAAYVELMAGVFTDNQPDFSFLAPGETKVFSQYWYPIQDIGPAHAATLDAAVRVDVERRESGWVAAVGVAVTSARPGCRLVLTDDAGAELGTAVLDTKPGSPGRHLFPLDVEAAAGRLRLSVRHGGAELVGWDSQVPDPVGDDPRAASEPPPPAALGSVEELVLTGGHLEQYRHATRSPEPYWREALRRDSGHVGARLGLATAAYRRGEPAQVVRLLEPAVGRLTALNPNPPETAALYLLGLALDRLGRADRAYELFAAAAWSRAWRAPAGFRMARLDAAAGRDTAALDRLADVLRVEPEHLQARGLAAVLLRRTGQTERAEDLARQTRALDRLDWWSADLLGERLTTDAQTCLDLALEYAAVGEAEAALRVLDVALAREADRADGQPACRPLLHYHRAAQLRALGRDREAAAVAAQARAADPGWCFPVRLDDVRVLTDAVVRDPTDGRARALLGHWLYAHDRPAAAIEAWTGAATADSTDPVVWRNLGLAAYNHGRDPRAARAAYDRARDAAPDDAQLLLESDQLDARRAVPPEQRLARLLAHEQPVRSRDDASIELAQLLLSAGRLGEARDLLLARDFQPWEGGEGLVLAAWDRLCILTAEQALATADGAGGPARAALQAVEQALDPPATLGEGRHPLANTARLHLLRGDALAALGDPAGARTAWRTAAEQEGDFVEMNADAFSAATASSILALRRLHRDAEADALAAALRTDCERLLTEPARVDYFATSLPSLLLFDEDLDAVQHKRASFRLAQLDALTDDPSAARARLADLLAADPAHPDALDLSARLDREQRAPRLQEDRA